VSADVCPCAFDSVPCRRCRARHDAEAAPIPAPPAAVRLVPPAFPATADYDVVDVATGARLGSVRRGRESGSWYASRRTVRVVGPVRTRRAAVAGLVAVVAREPAGKR
jgi:hypothetical protein